MNKKLIAVSIAAAVAAPAAMADVTIYGKVRQSIDMYDSTSTAASLSSYFDGEAEAMVYSLATSATDKDFIEIRDQASRIGFKGSEDLGDGMKAVWQMEFGVDISNNGGKAQTGKGSEFDAGSVVSARNAFVGLAGDFGTVLVGRHDTPLKISTGSLDPFADSSADYNASYMGGLTDLRADGTLAYISPSFSGLTVAAAVVPGENNQADGVADAWSAAAMYSNGGIFLTAAMESGNSDIDFLDGFLAYPDPYWFAVPMDAEYDQWRVGGSYAMDAFKVGAMYANTEFNSEPLSGFYGMWEGTSMDKETDHWSIFGTYTMGNNVFKVRYFDNETTTKTSPYWDGSPDPDSADSITQDANGWAIGWDHNFSARTQLSLLYVNSESDTSAHYAFYDVFDDDEYQEVDGKWKDSDTEIFSIQLNHSF